MNKLKSSIMKPISKLMYIFLIFGMFQSCETDVPEEDNTPPTFQLTISGDGFTRHFTQADDFDSFQLNLNSQAEYSFALVTADQGGVEEASLQWCTDGVQLISDIPTDWFVTNSGLSTFLVWEGDSSNPLTGNACSGNFTVQAGQNELVGCPMNVFVKDFGGESGDSNTTFKTLNLLIGYNTPTEIVYYD